MSKRTLTAAALIMGAALTAPAATASAASCWTTTNPAFTSFTCRLPANSTNHFIHISTGPFVTVDAIDFHSFVRVYHGKAGVWGIEKTVTGLYSVYYLAGTSTVLTTMELSNN